MNTQGGYTWSNGITESRLDYIFMSDILLDYVKELKILNVEDVLNTDHKRS